MRRVFIDCGYHLGEGLAEFASMLSIDDSWDVYAFEANPYCEIEKKISQHPFKVEAYNKAVWIKDGKALFNCESQKASESPTTHSTNELDGWGSCLADINSTHSYVTKEEVETIDFSRFLEQFRGREVLVKMDIEGAEFSVLRKCIEDGSGDVISTMWVEWHDVDLAEESAETVQQIKDNLKQTLVHDWR